MKKILKKVFFILIPISIIAVLLYFYSIDFIITFETFANWLYPKNEDRNGELFKVLLSILGAFGILYGLYISLRRAKAIEKGLDKQSEALNLQSEQLNLTRISQISEQFKNAIEHLGSDKEPIILGGVSELNQIAKENETKYSEIVFNILTGYIRSNTKKEKYKTVIQTIIDFVFNENITYNKYSADLSYCDLIGINFVNKNLSNINFSYSKLSSLVNCKVKNVDFSQTKFFFSNIEDISFENTKINNTIFYGGNIKDTTFNNLNDYPSANFVDCNIVNVSFHNIKMSDWKFLTCIIERCDFLDNEIISSEFCFNFFDYCSFENSSLFGNNDFRISLFNNVLFKNNIITSSNFNGTLNKHKFTRPYISEIENFIGNKSEMKGIINENSTFHRCSYESITQKDIDEIKELNETIRKKVFPK
jgi:uncharacterized protein YjbI with pentapeptide repeats